MTDRPAMPARFGSPRVVLTKAEHRLLVGTLRIQTHSGHTERMRDHITAMVSAMTDAVSYQVDDNVYVIKGIPPPGGVYPCFVAHTDTVHPIVGEEEYEVFYQENSGPYLEADLFAMDPKTRLARGIGGDDKCGIAIALMLLAALPYGKAVFTRDEEEGCQGAKTATLDFFADCAFLLQADRRDGGDLVRRACGVPMYGDEFDKAIAPLVKAFGFKDAYGMPTDVLRIVEREVGICALNCSAGYYMPHSDRTYVKPNDVARTRMFFERIVETCGNQRWEYTPPKTTTYHYSQRNDELGYGGEFGGGYHGTGGVGFRQSNFNDSRWKRQQDQLSAQRLLYRSIALETDPEQPPCPKCQGPLTSTWWCNQCKEYRHKYCLFCGGDMGDEPTCPDCLAKDKAIADGERTKRLEEIAAYAQSLIYITPATSMAEAMRRDCPWCGNHLAIVDGAMCCCLTCKVNVPEVWPGLSYDHKLQAVRKMVSEVVGSGAETDAMMKHYLSEEVMSGG